MYATPSTEGYPLTHTADHEQIPRIWTTRSLLDWMRSAFEKRGIDSPRLSAEMLLCHVIGGERMRLYAHADRPAGPSELADLRALVARALEHEPIQYLVGEGWFFSYPFTVDRRALIPRPSTETLLEHALQWLRTRESDGPIRLADVCTGSGCIAVSALKSLPEAVGTATDLSPEALALAQQNADRHGVSDRLTFYEGDLDHPLDGQGPYDLILSNPPYIPDHEWDSVEPNVKDHEPTMALRAGPTGLEFVAPLVDRLPSRLKPGGLLVIEIASCTADDALGLAKQNPLVCGAQILDDLDGLPRVLSALRAG